MKRSLLAAAFILTLVSLLLAACAAPAPPFQDTASVPAAAPAPPRAEEFQAEKEAFAGEGQDQIDSESVLADRKVIYNANMGLVVADAELAAQQVQELAAAFGGYVANMNAYRGGANALYYNVTLRVPSDQFDAARAALRDLAVRVEDESISTNDVTDQYYDLDARLRTLKATEEELLALLKETRERGGSVEDIMTIYRELTDIQSQIESLQGQLNRLDKLVALSTIDVRLQPDVLNQPITSSWRPLETLRRSFEILINALQGLIDIFIFIFVVMLPVLLILAIPVLVLFLIVRWLVRRRKTRSAEVEQG